MKPGSPAPMFASWAPTSGARKSRGCSQAPQSPTKPAPRPRGYWRQLNESLSLKGRGRGPSPHSRGWEGEGRLKRPDPGEPSTLIRAREARRGSLPAERKLWSRLRSRQLNGAKFRRQVWLGPFIADFFCADAKLIVEVDGDSHAGQTAYDERRTKWLA